MGQEMVLPESMRKGTMSSVLAGHTADSNDELSGGIVSSFAVLAYRGKVWRVRFRGVEENLVTEAGDPMPAVEMVIIKAAPHLSKVYYAGGYNEDASSKPDCASANNINPDVNIIDPISAACATCPMNQLGSRITENGKRAKACSDHKRTVVVPLLDMGNELYGGPMLMRIPAASLGELSAYANLLKPAGYIYYGVGTRVRFDINEAYPKLVFNAIRALADDEAAYILSLRDDPQVARILSESPAADVLDSDEAPKQALFEQPPQTAPKAPTHTKAPTQAPQAPQATKAPTQAPRAAPTPAPTPAPRVVAKPVSAITTAVQTPAPRPVARPVVAASAPVAARPATQAPKAAAPAPATHEEQGEAPGDFQAALDTELDALLADA